MRCGSGVTIDAVPLGLARSYPVTVNSFLATGGDGFTVSSDGTVRVCGDVDIDALEDYLVTNRPIAPPALNRITRLN